MLLTIEQASAIRQKAEADILATLKKLHEDTGLSVMWVDVTMIHVDHLGLRELKSYPAGVRVELRL